jgi:general secretion pathway protein K
MARKQRGIALITAIWVLAVLVILVGGFAAMVHGDVAIARNYGEIARARWAARSGLRVAEAAMVNPETPFTLGTETALVFTPADGDDTLAGMTYQATVTDEAGRINLNTATAETLAVYFTPDVVDAIIDWRDDDDTPRSDGAEDDYYMSLDPPYHCRNGAFATVHELRLVKGVTQALLDAPMGDGGPKLDDLLTVSSHDANTDATGKARVNVKTASKEALTQALGDVLKAPEIDAIIKQRGTMPFTSPADLLRVPGLAKTTVAQIFDRVTTSDAKDRAGLVNINTAPAEVLAAVPGLDAATAQTIVTTRAAQGEPFKDVGALLAVDGLGDEAFMKAADTLTARSQTYRILAVGQDSDKLSATVTCINEIETTGGTRSTRPLYWRE